MTIYDFALSYQKSPIILTNGIASSMPGGLLPIISITEAASFNTGVLDSSSQLALEDFQFDFYPAAGGTLADFKLGEYPFANQQVAANAIIFQPLVISLIMLAPTRGDGGWARKLSTFQALQSALTQHANQGGTYTVATPAYLYTDLLLLGLRDASQGDPLQPQSRWQWDFRRPLLTQQQAQAAQNALMQKISNGAQVVPGADGKVSYSGQEAAVGNPASGVGPSVVPAAQPLSGASVSGAAPTGGTKP